MTEVLYAFACLLIFPGFLFLFACALLVQWIDRRVIALLQGRVGPPWYQPLADFIKLLGKEDVLPEGAHELACALLPMVSVASVLTAALYVPVGGYVAASFEGDVIVVLFLLSLPALAYFLAGWLSASVFSVVGGSRALLQYFAYEVPFMMALSGTAILAGSWSVAEITISQSARLWTVLLQPLGFLIAFLGLIGKLKRSPFDIPKAKSEIGAGPLTEFSGRKLALWNLSLHLKTAVGIFLLVDVYLGGSGPVVTLAGAALFALKGLLVLLALSVAGVLYARLRIDQLADLGWRVLAPIALLQVLLVGLLGG
jgi:NADH-quinone oxidoreductase subunit H